MERAVDSHEGADASGDRSQIRTDPSTVSSLANQAPSGAIPTVGTAPTWAVRVRHNAELGSSGSGYLLISLGGLRLAARACAWGGPAWVVADPAVQSVDPRVWAAGRRQQVRGLPEHPGQPLCGRGADQGQVGVEPAKTEWLRSSKTSAAITSRLIPATAGQRPDHGSCRRRREGQDSLARQ